MHNSNDNHHVKFVLYQLSKIFIYVSIHLFIYLSFYISIYLHIHLYIYVRFVLYQLSKNLNRPFFVDFLTHLSIRYTDQGGKLDEEDPEETGTAYRVHRRCFTVANITFVECSYCLCYAIWWGKICGTICSYPLLTKFK